jgi:outer membrane protein
MKKHTIALLLAGFGLTTGAIAADVPAYGIVNFASCVMESKLGKQEQSSFETLKKQMASLLEDTEKQLTELSGKFNDKEYLDSLSPEAEEELKIKLRTLNEELGRYQNQYYQVLNQANMKLIQVMQSNINTAAEKVAKEKKLAMIINKEACFFYSPALEITSSVVAEMDKTYDTDSKKSAAVVPVAAPSAAVAAPQETAAIAPVESKEEVKTAAAPATTAPKEEAKTVASAPAAKNDAKATTAAPSVKTETKKK